MSLKDEQKVMKELDDLLYPKIKKEARMPKDTLILNGVFTPAFEKLEGEQKRICEGLWKILNLSVPEIAEKLDISNDAAAHLRGLAFEKLEPFLKKS